MPLAATPFSTLAPGLGVGAPLPPGWRPIGELPLLIIVGVTGVGKSTTLARLTGLGLPYTLLPDRRVLTDALIITAMQRLDNAPIQPVTDRTLRFDYTRRYRDLYPGGMAQALTQLVIDPETIFQADSAAATQPNRLLVFDGLRGENEIECAAGLLPLAHFVMLDAPDVVRVQRLLGRRDEFDQVGSMGNGQAQSSESSATAGGFAKLGVIEATGIFTPAEERSLLRLVESDEVTPADLRAKLQIVVEERRNYDPAATRGALLRCAGDRALVIDTARHSVNAVADLMARQIRAWGLAQ